MKGPITWFIPYGECVSELQEIVYKKDIRDNTGSSRRKVLQSTLCMYLYMDVYKRIFGHKHNNFARCFTSMDVVFWVYIYEYMA